MKRLVVLAALLVFRPTRRAVQYALSPLAMVVLVFHARQQIARSQKRRIPGGTP